MGNSERAEINPLLSKSNITEFFKILFCFKLLLGKLFFLKNHIHTPLPGCFLMVSSHVFRKVLALIQDWEELHALLFCYVTWFCSDVVYADFLNKIEIHKIETHVGCQESCLKQTILVLMETRSLMALSKKTGTTSHSCPMTVALSAVSIPTS